MEPKSGTIEMEPHRLRPNLEGTNLEEKSFLSGTGSGTVWFVSNGRISNGTGRETVWTEPPMAKYRKERSLDYRKKSRHDPRVFHFLLAHQVLSLDSNSYMYS